MVLTGKRIPALAVGANMALVFGMGQNVLAPVEAFAGMTAFNTLIMVYQLYLWSEAE